jgi:hypothetical protein
MTIMFLRPFCLIFIFPLRRTVRRTCRRVSLKDNRNAAADFESNATFQASELTGLVGEYAGLVGEYAGLVGL